MKSEILWMTVIRSNLKYQLYQFRIVYKILRSFATPNLRKWTSLLDGLVD